MSKKEMIKEDINTYRAYLLLLSTSLFGVLGYAIINLERLSKNQMILGALAGAGLFVIFVFILKKYIKARKKLGDLE